MLLKFKKIIENIVCKMVAILFLPQHVEVNDLPVEG